MSLRPLLALPFLFASHLSGAEDLGVLLRRAREARNAAQWPEALKAYDAMLAIVDTHETALFERAQTLAWAGRHAESIQAWKLFRQHFPGRSAEANLNLARVLSWAGRLEESKATYRAYLAAHPNHPDALAGLARVSLWTGDPLEARRLVDQLAPEALKQPDNQVLLAQVELAEGHRRAAKARLRPLASQDGPNRKDAEGLLCAAADAQGPSVEISQTRTESNEGLVSEDPALLLRLPLGDGNVDLGGARHKTSFLGQERSLTEASLGLSYPLGPVRLLGGLSRYSDIGGTPASGHRLGFGWRIAKGIDLHLATGRTLAYFTPMAIDHRVAIQTYDGALAFSSPSQNLRLSAGGASLSTDTTRKNWLGTYEYRWRFTPIQVSLGLVTRGMDYSKTLNIGFFNPERYRFTGLTGGFGFEQGGFSGSLVARSGRQIVNQQDSKTAWGYDADLSWRPAGSCLTGFVAWSEGFAGLPIVDPTSMDQYKEQTLRFGLRVAGPWR